MSTELSVVTQTTESLAEMMGINLNVGQTGPSISRLNVNQTQIEAEVEFNGKKLRDTVVPLGAYKLQKGEDVVYASKVHIRVFATRDQYQRWNGDTKEMEKTVLAKSLNQDLMDNQGGFNLGRPSGFVEDFKALPKATQDIMRTAKSVKVYFGLVTLENPLGPDGQPVDGEYVDIPFVMDVKNAPSKKQLAACIKTLARQNTLPIMQNITLTPGEDQIPTGAKYGHIVAALGEKVELKEEDNDTLRNFLEFIEYINGTIIDKHHERNKDSLSEEDAGIVASILEVDDE